MFRERSRGFRRSTRRFLNAALSLTGLRRRKDVEEAIVLQYRNSHNRVPTPRELQSGIDAVLSTGLSLKRVLKNISRLPQVAGSLTYQEWVERFDTISGEDERRIRAHIHQLSYRPLISIVMPAFNTNDALLRAAINSVTRQIYGNWELCIADDASTLPSVPDTLRELAEQDSRIKWMRRAVNGHISRASNSALELAAGEFVALMDHDDLLPPHALYMIAVELNRHPDADLLYSDEDRVDDDNVRNSAYFKSDWNLELMLGCNLISHLGIYRRALVERLGGFREGLEGSQDYDLALRVIASTSEDRIRHIPAVLYHWRASAEAPSFSQQDLPRCVRSARQAVGDFLASRREAAEVVANPVIPDFQRIRRPVPTPPPLVSLIVPTRNRPDLLGPCLEGLRNRTRYSSFEVIIVDHMSEEAESKALLARSAQDPRIRIVQYDGPFNYSRMNNLAVEHARGEIIGLINNDIDVIEPDWLAEMVSLAAIERNGAIGAKLLYPNGQVQHAGIIMGMNGISDHAFAGLASDHAGYCGRLALTSNITAVTGACMVLRKHVYEEVGGLNEVDLPVTFNDIDLCLKIRRAGYRNVWTPFALLYHNESASRGSDDLEPEKKVRAEREAAYMRRTWGDAVVTDPFYNPNLCRQSRIFQLAVPPTRVRSWSHIQPASEIATSG